MPESFLEYSDVLCFSYKAETQSPVSRPTSSGSLWPLRIIPQAIDIMFQTRPKQWDSFCLHPFRAGEDFSEKRNSITPTKSQPWLGVSKHTLLRPRKALYHHWYYWAQLAVERAPQIQQSLLTVVDELTAWDATHYITSSITFKTPKRT